MPTRSKKWRPHNQSQGEGESETKTAATTKTHSRWRRSFAFVVAATTVQYLRTDGSMICDWFCSLDEKVSEKLLASLTLSRASDTRATCRRAARRNGRFSRLHNNSTTTGSRKEEERNSFRAPKRPSTSFACFEPLKCANELSLHLLLGWQQKVNSTTTTGNEQRSSGPILD